MMMKKVDDSGRSADEREVQLPRKSAAHGMLVHAGGYQNDIGQLQNATKNF